MGRRAASRQCQNNKSKINKRKTQSITLIWLYLPNIRYRFWFLGTLEWSWCHCHSFDWFCIDMSCMRVSLCVCGFVYLYERWFRYFFCCSSCVLYCRFVSWPFQWHGMVLSIGIVFGQMCILPLCCNSPLRMTKLNMWESEVK